MTFYFYLCLCPIVISFAKLLVGVCVWAHAPLKLWCYSKCLAQKVTSIKLEFWNKPLLNKIWDKTLPITSPLSFCSKVGALCINYKPVYIVLELDLLGLVFVGMVLDLIYWMIIWVYLHEYFKSIRRTICVYLTDMRFTINIIKC